MLQHRRRGTVRPGYRGRVCSLWESLLHLHQTDPGGGQLHPQTANYPPRPQGILNSPSRFFHPSSPICSILFNSQLVTFQPENILCLTKSGNRIKIIDFGLARRFEPMKKLQILFGTPEFVAPEVFFFFIIFKSFHLGFSEFSLCSYTLQLPSKVVNFEPIGYSTDMWALGVITYVLWVSSRIIEHPIWVFFVTYILWASFITHMRSVSIFKPLIKSFFCGPIRLTESWLRRLDLVGGRINQAILLMLALTWFWYSKSFFNFFVFILIWHTSINMAFIPWASLS